MHNELVKKGHRAFSAQSRCWPGGTPGQLLFLQPFYFIQTAQEVWMIWERDHQVRRVYLNREHSQIRSLPGSANPSVITRTATSSSTPSVSLSIPTASWIISPHRTPRICTWWNAGKSAMTETRSKRAVPMPPVDDPGAFKAPSGRACICWRKVNRPIAEWAFAENNLSYEQAFALQEYPMPVANTPDF